MRDEESVIDALEPVVLLSGNPECHSSLLAYLCLPKASGQLISLAHMDSGSTVINNHIAVLIGNLFNVSKTINSWILNLCPMGVTEFILHTLLDSVIYKRIVGVL